MFVQFLQIMSITMTRVAKINSEYSNCTKADTCSHIICIGIIPSEMVVKIICRHGSDTTKIVHRRQHKRPVKSLDLLPIVDIAAGGIISWFDCFRGSFGHTWLAICVFVLRHPRKDWPPQWTVADLDGHIPSLRKHFSILVTTDLTIPIPWKLE